MRDQPRPGSLTSAARRTTRTMPREFLVVRIASVLSLVMLVACGGQGCNGCSGNGGLAPISGGFPVAQRQPNAIQVRATQGLFSFLSQNGPALAGQFLPMGGIAVPSSCTGDTQICCNTSCTVNATFTALNFNPQPPSTMGLQVRAKLKSNSNFPIKAKAGPITVSCNISFDTGASSPGDIGIGANMVTSVDGTTNLTSLNIDPNSISIADLNASDITISGSFGCDVIDFVKGLFLSTLEDQLTKQLGGPLSQVLSGELCQTCADAATDCPSFAGVACANKVCTRGSACIQRIGLEGHFDTSKLLGSFAGGATTGLDMYAVAGGYAAVEASGLSLGMLGGGAPSPTSSCVPARPAPTGTLARTKDYSGNNAPNGTPYHLGMGVSTLELNLLGYSFYSTGGLCLQLGTAQVPQLASGLLGALLPSMADLTRAQSSAVTIVMKPQQPPTFTLGKGTFKVGANGQKTIDDPLIKLGAQDFGMDFYLYMDDRLVRIMTLTADLSLPLGLDVDSMQRIVPILGDLTTAFGNLRVTNSQLLKEKPAVLAALFPKLLPLLLGQLTAAIPPVTLPNFVGFGIDPVQITSTAGADGSLSYLGLFLALEKVAGMSPVTGAATMPAVAVPAETQASLLSLEVPTLALLATTTTRAVLRVDAAHPSGGALEWQYAVDGGLWRPFDAQHQIVLDDASLGLPGSHYVDVRARVVGAPRTLDPTPARVDFVVTPAGMSSLEGGSGQSALFAAGDAAGTSSTTMATGCAVVAGPARGSASGAGALAMMLLTLGLCALGLRRRRPTTLLTMGGLVVLGAGLQGACGNNTSMPPGPPAGASNYFSSSDEIGRWMSAVSRAGGTYISAYNTSYGDLAYAELSDPAAGLKWQVVDGLPTGSAYNSDPNAPRKGFTQPGPDVGRYTSLTFTSKATPVIAYQDVTNGLVKLAVGPGPSWTVIIVDKPTGTAKLGAFAQVALDSSEVPTVAYQATGVSSAGTVVSQMVVAHGHGAVGSVSGPSDFDHTVVDAAATDKTPPTVLNTPQGTGSYAHLVMDSQGGKLVFYNTLKGALMLAQGPAWKQATVLDGGDGVANVGQHATAAVASDGTLHVAYQDSAGGRLLYRTFAGGTAGKVEVADSGARSALMEQHRVGASAMLVVKGTTLSIVYQDQTAGTLELAQRSASGTWTEGTKAPGVTRARGYFAQAVPLNAGLLLLDVVYDHSKTPISDVELTMP